MLNSIIFIVKSLADSHTYAIIQTNVVECLGVNVWSLNKVIT
jgi:hypothetical protein